LRGRSPRGTIAQSAALGGGAEETAMLAAFKKLNFAAQVVLSVVLAAAIGFIGYQFWPNIAEQKVRIGKQQQKLQALQAEIVKGQNLEKKLPELEREIAQLEAQLEELKAIIPPVRDDSKLLSQFESIAKRSRLDINKMAPQRTRRKEFYDEYPISVDVVGNYHDLAKFFDRMANLPRIFNVQGVKMRATKVQADSSVAANFTAVTFIYREDSDQPQPPAATKGKKKGKKKGGSELE
jgi:type IV pilus assembly protein PilO